MSTFTCNGTRCTTVSSNILLAICSPVTQNRILVQQLCKHRLFVLTRCRLPSVRSVECDRHSSSTHVPDFGHGFHGSRRACIETRLLACAHSRFGTSACMILVHCCTFGGNTQHWHVIKGKTDATICLIVSLFQTDGFQTGADKLLARKSRDGSITRHAHAESDTTQEQRDGLAHRLHAPSNAEI